MSTGYEITLPEFNSLIQEAAGRKAVAPLLAEWFGYSIRRNGVQWRLESSDGVPIDPLAVYSRTQQDPEKQLRIYRAAMSVWR